MGAHIRIYNKRIKYNEPICDIEVNYTERLKGITLSADDIISMIDEIPIFALVASYAHGKSKVIDGAELRHKESDRIKAIIHNLQKFNVDINLIRLWKLVESIKLDMFAFITCDDSITCLIQHEITDHEGYVMTNDYGMYKIVNRDMFSFYNFTLAKNWS